MTGRIRSQEVQGQHSVAVEGHDNQFGQAVLRPAFRSRVPTCLKRGTQFYFQLARNWSYVINIIDFTLVFLFKSVLFVRAK